MQKQLREHVVDRQTQALAAIANIDLISRSDTIIGFVWSKFCALAFELQYARDDHRTKLEDVLGGAWTPF